VEFVVAEVAAQQVSGFICWVSFYQMYSFFPMTTAARTLAHLGHKHGRALSEFHLKNRELQAMLFLLQHSYVLN
jgi:hypothetical protein